MLLLAHGAGAPMDSDAMNRITAALVATGFRVGRFEFPYMVNRRQDGRKRPPDGMKTLLRAWRDCIDQVLDACDPGEPLFIGGKSMGGRIATHILAEECPEAVAGAMVFGYPFHPPGKPDRWRIDHFPRLERPCGLPRASVTLSESTRSWQILTWAARRSRFAGSRMAIMIFADPSQWPGSGLASRGSCRCGGRFWTTVPGGAVLTVTQGVWLLCRPGFETDAGQELVARAAEVGIYGYFAPPGRRAGSGLRHPARTWMRIFSRD